MNNEGCSLPGCFLIIAILAILGIFGFFVNVGLSILFGIIFYL